MRVPWSREEANQPEPRPEPNGPRLLHLSDDGRLSVEPARSQTLPTPGSPADQPT